MSRLFDVAERAGVSRAAASSVLGAKPSNIGVSAATRERVLRAASELGYRQNPLAASFRTGKTWSIGVCLDAAEAYISHPEGALNFWHISRAAADRGYLVSLIGLRPDLRMDPRLIDGCIVVGSVRPELQQEMTRFAERIPVLSTDVPIPGAIEVKADMSWRAERRLAADYLYDLGHRSIAVSYIGRAGIEADVSAIFREVAERRGVAVHVHGLGEKTLTRRYRSLEALQSMEPFPTAFFAIDDQYARVLISRLGRRRLHVPEDVSVFSGSTHPGDQPMSPGLTGLNLHSGESLEQMVNMFIDIIEGRAPQRQIQLPAVKVDLIERESCAPPRT